MLIDSVTIESLSDSTKKLDFSFRDVGNRLPYQVRSMTGLDADEIVARYTGNPQSDDYGYNILEQAKREPTLLLGLNPYAEGSGSYSDLRDDIYRLIAATRSGWVYLKFKYGATVVAVLQGFISKVESNPFLKRPEMQITLNCNDYPMLRSPEPIELTVMNAPTITINDNLSTSPHGVKMVVEFGSNQSSFVFRDNSVSPLWKFQINYVFLTNDELTVSNDLKKKEVWVQRGASVIHLADKVTSDSTWPAVLPGVNTYDCPTADVTFTEISYHATYWGV